jgi:hypothetical protein
VPVNSTALFPPEYLHDLKFTLIVRSFQFFASAFFDNALSFDPSNPVNREFRCSRAAKACRPVCF